MSDIIKQVAAATENEAQSISDVTVDTQNHWVDFRVHGMWVTATLSSDNKRVYIKTIRVFKH